MLSKDQDGWVELVQKKISWGDLNQRRKQHYLDYQAQKKLEADKTVAIARDREAQKRAAQRAAQRDAENKKAAEEAQAARERQQQQIREQRQEACRNQVANNTVSSIFDIAGGGDAGSALFGGFMTGIQAGAAEAECNSR